MINDTTWQPFSTRTVRILLMAAIALSLLLQFSWLLSSSTATQETHNNNNNNDNNNNNAATEPILPLIHLASSSSSTTATATNTAKATLTQSDPATIPTLQWKNGCLSSILPTQASASASASITKQEAFGATSTTSTSTSTSGTNSETTPTPPKEQPPKGIVVTMALAPKNRHHLSQGRDQICNNLPNQWEWFLHPQGMDMLLVIQDEDKRWNTKRFARCLGLSNNHTATATANNATTNSDGITRTWYNFDGSKLITTEYNYTRTLHQQQQQYTAANEGDGATSSTTSMVTSSIKIYLATTFVQYPRYIRHNMTRLDDRKDGPPGCSARLRYLQGCRWYTQEMLHLSLLQEYDYFLKMDTDIMFRKSPPFHLLQDMQNKGAVFAHAAEYHPSGDGSCAPGILTAIAEFVREVNEHEHEHENMISSQPQVQYSWSNPRRNKNADNHQVSLPSTSSSLPPWKKQVCSTSSPEIQRDADQYYCNFLIGKVEYFTSPWMLEFATFLSEYPQGFFKQKWGDQIFWHFAMGMFLEDDFTKYVVDYTDLRCKPDPKCWYSVFDTEKYGPTAAEQCNGDLGIFVHSKSLDFVKQVQEASLSSSSSSSSKNQSAYVPSLPKTVGATPFEPLFESTYKHCQP